METTKRSEFQMFRKGPVGGKVKCFPCRSSMTQKVFLIVTVVLELLCPDIAGAVSYFPNDQEILAGEIVIMFYSGTPEGRKDVGINDTLPVFREGKKGNYMEVGKIVVTSVVNQFKIEGKVIDGQLIIGDIAEKKNAGCLIISSRKKSIFDERN
jgi:hypothetical protein